MDITSYINASTIAVNLKVNDKTELIEALIKLAEKSGKITDISQVRNAIFEREKLMSTGIGDGIAIPHAKSNAVSDTICSIAILQNPVDFDSVDNIPVEVAFLLIGREHNVGSHLRLLSKISRFLCDESKLKLMKQCKTPEDVVRLFGDGI